MAADYSRLLQAAVYAAERHYSQRRKDVRATPYINHPLAVAAVLAEHGRVTDEDVLVAAVLHDTVEDTATSLDELEATFGNIVRGLVNEVTDDKSLSKAQRKQLQIDNSPHKSTGAKQIKIADVICNVRDIDAESPAGWETDRKLEYLEWTKQVVAGCRSVNAALDALFDETLASARQRIEC